MKIPRNLSGVQLVKRLEYLGYTVTRQTGSHLRLTSQIAGIHHLTIPAHDSLRVGTLAAVIDNVSKHHGLTKDELLQLIF